MSSEGESSFTAYHVLMDTLVTGFRDRLAGVTSKRVADQFMITTATRVAEKLVGNSPDPVAAMRGVLLSNNCQISQTRTGDTTDWTVTCPYAHAVHPKTPSDTICPLALLFLGAIRLRESQSELVISNLTADGSRFTIKHKSQMVNETTQ